VKVAEKCKSQAMTKAALITVIANKLEFPWARAELLVDVVFGSMEQSMSRGEEIAIRATCPNYPYTRALWRRSQTLERIGDYLLGVLEEVAASPAVLPLQPTVLYKMLAGGTPHVLASAQSCWSCS
jgi:hypothetical protein